jgi:hypothetical protein
MVCFEIEIAYPIQKRQHSNTTYQKRIQHLQKHYCADPVAIKHNESFQHFTFAICDEDAVGFLRDLPFPTFCVKVAILRTNVLLYSNYKYTGVYVYPPRNQLLKRVYWQASSLQKYYNAI